MIQDPEDELLDQSLRETFSDFDLTPASHIWAGVKGRLASMPKAPGTVPYKLLLPLVGLVGVGVGWLLPRAEVNSSVAKTEQPATPASAALAASAQPAPVVPLGSAVPSVAPRRQQSANASSSANIKAVAGRPAIQPETTIPVPAPMVPAGLAQQVSVAPSPAFVATAGDTAPDTVLAETMPPVLTAAAPDSDGVLTAEAAAQPTPESVASYTVAGKASTTGVLRPDGAARERRTEYRTATHRRAEKGRSFRKRLVHLTQQMRHLFSPRRSKAAAQPDF